MAEYGFHQVDVFATGPLSGNPLAVVVGADGVSDTQMQRLAHWTNLSETTFLLRPENPDADYRVRIFTPQGELPFAGHPTLGSAAVWLAEGGQPGCDLIVQECGAGQVEVRRESGRLSFAAPLLMRSGAVEEALLAKACDGLGIDRAAVAAAEWVDNGPGWMALLLDSRARVLALEPDFQVLKGMRVGVVGPCPPGDDAEFELRGFTAAGFEDPVTGSLHAGVAQWLIAEGRAPECYVARQGTALGRGGAVYAEQSNGVIWIGGVVHHRVTGQVQL